MIALPSELAPWARELAIFPSDLALALAPWVGRIALAVGSLAAASDERAGDPDGYRGLARRGSYERLVATEWSLAELFPDEFVRRAAMGEHLFHELAHRRARAAQRSVAIVSAGPAQLGAPRLAHIAALVVLARRAAAAGVAFAWGVLEDRERRVTDGLDEAGVRRLLAARSATAAEAGAFEAWAAALGTDEIWAIGADEDIAAAGSRIAVRDVLDPSTRALELAVARRGHSACVRLELPPDDVCARCLREPFRRDQPRGLATERSPAAGVSFARAGHRLIVRRADGDFESWAIPSSVNEPVARPARANPSGVPVAVGTGRKALLVATANPDDPTKLLVQHGAQACSIELPAAAAVALRRHIASGAPVPIGACGMLEVGTAAQRLVIEVAGVLVIAPGFPVRSRSGSCSAELFAPHPTEAIATALLRDRVVWAERYPGDDGVVFYESTGTSLMFRGVVPAASAAYIGYSSRGWSAGTSSAGGHCTIPISRTPEVLAIECKAPVTGVTEYHHRPAFVVRSNSHRLALEFADKLRIPARELLPVSASPIASVAVCASAPLIAWVTEAGEAVVYSLARNAIVFRRIAGAA